MNILNLSEEGHVHFHCKEMKQLLLIYFGDIINLMHHNLLQ